MTPSRVNSVVVVGRDCDLWLTVIAMAQALGPAGVAVTAVELPSRLAPGEVLASLPQLIALQGRLGITLEELFAATGGSISLGQSFVIAGPHPTTFFHAWDRCGLPIDGHDFLHCWLRARSEGLNVGLRHFSPAAEAARHGRILLDDECAGDWAQGGHLPAAAYAGLLKSLAARRRIVIRQAAGVTIEPDASGGIAAVVLEGSATRVTGDLFVDASGEDAVLIGGALGCCREPWTQDWGADRVVFGLAPAFTVTPPFAEVRTAAGGWTALHPTPGATGIVHAFRGSITSDAEAVAAAAAAAGTALGQVCIRAHTAGILRQPWIGNCVAIGAAAVRLDPLHDLGLHVLQLSIVQLISLFPASRAYEAERREYNIAMRSYCGRLRDFQQAFHALAPRLGPFWNGLEPRSDSLEHTLATFRASAYLPPHEHETLSSDSWHSCLLGLGLVPERWPPGTERLSAERLRQVIERLLADIRARVLKQPLHDAYLSTFAAKRNSNRPAALERA